MTVLPDPGSRALAPLERHIPPLSSRGTEVPSEQLLETFLEYCLEIGLELYPAQEEAILEIFSGQHVILNTPTGSGKSLVGLAACFKAISEGRTAFYTAPIKALVTEKFFELCEVLGATHVGLMIGDGSVNREAPVICCTAEILANLALREGAACRADWVVMDEFHYYSDRDRGSAWQIPLLTLPKSRFVLMSATLGRTDFFLKDLEARTGVGAVLVSSTDRPVPLDFEYRETPLQESVDELVASGRYPIYMVHFSQREACEQAQNLMSVNFLSKEEKTAIKEELHDFEFHTAFGKDLKRYIHHGVGVHHAGMLPKYRRLVERLSRTGKLRIICGTDTLGVGVNVPIRSVLFTKLCKFDGENTAVLTVRDFQQIAGRAGRRGYDDRGSVVVQAPEHEVENKALRAKAAGNPKKARKLRPRKPPERGYAPWNAQTLDKLKDGSPEALASQFQVNHGMMLNVLSRPEGGCRAAKDLLRDCHERRASKHRLFKTGLSLFRSLVRSDVVSLGKHGVRVNADLQQDFSLNQALSLYAVEAAEAIDPDHADFPMTILSVIESTLENPSVILRAQVSRLKTLLIADLKAEGVEYDDRMKELDEVDYPKPDSEFIYETFNLFAKEHPWVSGQSIRPKSIAREMYEKGSTFNGYIKEYGLARAEGVLLRYLTDVYRALSRTLPQKHKTDEVVDVEEWLAAELKSIDSSLIEEWENLQAAEAGEEVHVVKDAPPKVVDITANRRAFEVLTRKACWRIVRALSGRDYSGAMTTLLELDDPDAVTPKDPNDVAWTATRLGETLSNYWSEYDAILIDSDARNPKLARITADDAETWTVEQTLSDPERNLEWRVTLESDVAAARERNRLVMRLVSIDCG